MLLENHHIIKEQLIEIEFEKLDNAIGIQNRIAEVYYDRLLPSMTALFDEMAGHAHFLSIDRLEIDCGLLSAKQWEDEWVANTLRKLKEQLAVIDKKIDGNTEASSRWQQPVSIEIEKHQGPSGTMQHAFFFFLEHGYLPWNRQFSSVEEMERRIPITHGLTEKLKELIKTRPVVAERIANQFSEKFCLEITGGIISNSRDGVNKVLALFKKMEASAGKHVARAAILYALSGDGMENPEKMFLEFIVTHRKNRYDSLETGPDKKINIFDSSKNAEEKEGVYISNAGLVIVHPFLTQLVETLNLVKDQQWSHNDAPHMAARIIEFIATGENECPEFNLPLNKILCGIPVDEAIQPVVDINEEIKQQCDSLINDVIRYWQVLKNTGIDSFRETFLQRNGKLTKMDHGWLLQVEQKGLDILLSHLPWGIGTIKLPWMKELLFVEWC